MKKLLAHIARTTTPYDVETEIVVALCEKHSEWLTEAIEGINCDDCICTILPGAVENIWGYKFNRCELCAEDFDKDFLKD